MRYTNVLCCLLLSFLTLSYCIPWRNGRRLHRKTRDASRPPRIPYASLSAGAIPSRVRARLRGTSTSSSSLSDNAASSQANVGDSRDVSSQYPANGYGAPPRYPQAGGYANPSHSQDSQSQFSQQSGNRPVVPVGSSTFPYDTAGIYNGPSQNRYSSQPLPVSGMAASYGGGNGYQSQGSRYPQTPQYNPYAGYGGGYNRGYNMRNPYGYGGMYGGGMGQMSHPYGYGQMQNPSMGYYGNTGYTGYQDSSATIGSPYRDPNAMFTSYVHPQANSRSRGYSGSSSSYGSSDSYYGSNPYGQSSSQSGYGQAADRPSYYDGNSYGGSYGSASRYGQTSSSASRYSQPQDSSSYSFSRSRGQQSSSSSSYGQDQSSNPFYNFGRSQSQSPSSSSQSQSPSSSSSSSYGQDQSSNPLYGFGRSQSQSLSSISSNSHGQDQSSNPLYGFGRSQSQSSSGISSSSHGQDQSGNSYYNYGESSRQYGSDASAPHGEASRSSYDRTSYSQGDRYGTTQDGSRQGAVSSNRRVSSSSISSNYVPSSAQSQRYGSRTFAQHFASPQDSSRSEDESSSRIRNPSSADQTGFSSSNSRHYQTGNGASQSTRSNSRSSRRYFVPTPLPHPQTSRIFSGQDATSRPQSPGQSGGSRSQMSGRVQYNDTNVESYSDASYQESQGTFLIPRRHGSLPEPERTDTRRNFFSPIKADPLEKCQSQSDGLPDLHLDSKSMQRYMSVETRHRSTLTCAIQENCISSAEPKLSRRILLKFPTVVHNKGKADFVPDMLPGDWEYHTCHMHYHSMKEFAHFELIDRNNTVVGEGHKVSFCLQDSGCNNPCRPRYNCTATPENKHGTQGISPGCYDDYKASIDCQWIDITGVPVPAKYRLRVTVNPPNAVDGERAVPEMSYTNNAVECKISLESEYALTVYSCYGA